MGPLDQGLRADGREVVAIEGDVEGADGELDPLHPLDLGGDLLGEGDAAGADAGQEDRAEVAVMALGDLPRHPANDPGHLLGVEDRRLRRQVLGHWRGALQIRGILCRGRGDVNEGFCYPPRMKALRVWEDEERFFAGAREATRFFMGESDVQHAADTMTRLLDENSIPYAIMGGLALNAYGYSHVTVDVDILLTRRGIAAFKNIHPELTENGVSIDVILAGEYPGDGLPKPVSFPDPASAAVRKGDRLGEAVSRILSGEDDIQSTRRFRCPAVPCSREISGRSRPQVLSS